MVFDFSIHIAGHEVLTWNVIFSSFDCVKAFKFDYHFTFHYFVGKFISQIVRNTTTIVIFALTSGLIAKKQCQNKCQE